MELKINVAIIDDHPMLIRGLKNMLECSPLIRIIGAYLSAAEFLESLPGNMPDVLLTDILMPRQNGEELASHLQQHYPQIGMIAFTNLEQQYYVKSMINRGVMGYVIKNSGEKIILEAIHAVYGGTKYFDPAIKPDLIKAIKHPDPMSPKDPILSAREKEILELIAADYNSNDIAKKLFISKRTVDFHRINLLLKLNVKKSASLVHKAIELGIIK